MLTRLGSFELGAMALALAAALTNTMTQWNLQREIKHQYRRIKMERDLVNPKCTRKEVYEAIDSERDYQAEFSKDTEKCQILQKSVGCYLTMMQGYMGRTFETWISTGGVEPTLHFIRKIAGIAVKCMEQHGAPKR